MVCQIYTID